MAVHFKFRSAIEYDSVNIDGHFITIANLKEKIIQQKSLGKGTDIDLVVTNAQNGEEYTSDSQVIPKNTSVIIKRVPATRAITTLLVQDQTQSDDSEFNAAMVSKDMDGFSMAVAIANTDFDGMDDFGVDPYTVPNPAPALPETEEDSKIAAFVNKAALDWQCQAPDASTSGRGYCKTAYGRAFARGRGFGTAVPPPGYVCHRCGHPGHFIQHCPTNGDPAFDMKKMKIPVGIPKARLKADQEGSYMMADGSVAAMEPDEAVFAKEADALLAARPTAAELPPELRCPICQEIFKEAVMIPCCHYSFCDKCIRQVLVEKAECPQCESTKVRNDDLLPNIALRQAIDHFLEVQFPATSGNDMFKQQIADVESGTRAKASSPALSGIKVGTCKTTTMHLLTSGVDTTEKEQNPAAVTELVCESVIGSREKNVADMRNAPIETGNTSATLKVVHIPDESEAVERPASKESDYVGGNAVVKMVSHLPSEGKQPVNHIGEGPVVSKMSGVSQKEADVIMESDVSKGVFSRFQSSNALLSYTSVSENRGSKRKKRRLHQVSADGVVEHTFTGKLQKGDRCCYVCGSPDHLARDCPDNSAPFNLHRGMFRPGGPVSAGGMPYGSEMFWHGPPVSHMRPFPMGYGDGIYGTGPIGIPFEVPKMPVGPYAVTPFIPSIYHNAAIHPGFIGGMGSGMVVPMERPLSREEFMELQERERQRRLIHEQERERSQAKSISRETEQTHSSEPRQRMHHQRKVPEEQQSVSRKRESDQHSVWNYSDDTDHHRSKSSRHIKKAERVATEIRGQPAYETACGDEIGNDSKTWMLHQQRHLKVISSEVRKESRYHDQGSTEKSSSELEDGEESYFARGREEREHVILSKQSSLKRHGDSSSKRHQDSSCRRYDDISSQRYGHSSTKRYDKCLDVVSAEDSYFNYPRSKNEDSKRVSRSERKDAWQIGNDYEDIGKREKPSIHANWTYNKFVGKDNEKHKRKHKKSSKSNKSDADVENASKEEMNKKKKRKHEKYRENSEERLSDLNYDFLDDVHKRSTHKKAMLSTAQLIGSSMGKQKLKNSSYLRVSSMEDPIEESRWQMDSGFDDVEDAGHHSHRSRKLQQSQCGKSV